MSVAAGIVAATMADDETGDKANDIRVWMGSSRLLHGICMYGSSMHICTILYHRYYL